MKQEFSPGDKVTAWYDVKMVVGTVTLAHRCPLRGYGYQVLLDNSTTTIQFYDVDLSLYPITLVELDDLLDGLVYV